ncbi:SET domain containing protein, partial [Aphelenchoides avenae]
MAVDATKVTRFLDWVRDEEVLMDLAELRYCGPGVGFGVFAKSNIRWNEIAIRVPKKLMITAGLIADMAEYAEILKVHRLDPFEVLVLFFCLERVKGAESSWSAYLDVLPATFSTAIATCPDLPLEQLPLTFRQQFIKQREEFDAILAKVTSVKHVSRETVDWAWHVVNTRCIFVDNAPHPLVDSSKSGDNLAVIPVMDMLNHSPEAQCVAYFDKHSQKYCVAAQNRSVQAGDQLFVCYGPHDNIRLWVEYGFRLEDNVFNRVNISIDLFIALARKVNMAVDSEREDVLREAALP